jgi:hypothetical protein
LNGLLSNKALLGMGWAHTTQGEHQRALVPWVELADRNAVDAAVQESLLAVPYAFGKLGAYRQSLERYEAALEIYTRESARLDEAIAAIRAGKLVENILRANPADEAGWFFRMRHPPDAPEARYLTELLASHAFQEALKNYRDLRFLQQNLDNWEGKLTSYHDMVATRRQAYAERLPRVLSRERTLDVQRLHAARDEYSAELARIERDGDAAALANDKEKALLERLGRVERALGSAGDVLYRDVRMSQAQDAQERPEARDKHRRYRGLLAWDLSSQYSARLWEAKKGMKQIDTLLGEVGGRREVLERAQVEAPQSFEAFTGRIETQRRRIGELRPGVDAVARAQEQHLAELAADELTRQRERIAAYVTQARFAVAQIYDQAVRAEETKQ